MMRPRAAANLSAAHGAVRVVLTVIVIGMCLLTPFASAQEIRLLVQSSPLAGFTYHQAPQWFNEMRVGDALTLVREPANPHDDKAIQVFWKDHLLGYVPRTQNETLAWAMDRGDAVMARVSKLRQHRNPRLRIEFEVFLR